MNRMDLNDQNYCFYVGLLNVTSDSKPSSSPYATCKTPCTALTPPTFWKTDNERRIRLSPLSADTATPSRGDEQHRRAADKLFDPVSF